MKKNPWMVECDDPWTVNQSSPRMLPFHSPTLSILLDSHRLAQWHGLTTAVAATATNDTDVVAVGRAETIIQVVATSPPAGSQRRLQDGSSREQIAFSFIGDGAQGSPDIFWDPEAGVDYMRSATSGVGALVFFFEYYGWILVGTVLVLFA